MTTPAAPADGVHRQTLTPAEKGGRPGVVAGVIGFVPTVFVVACLVGVALWGHATEWRFTHARGPSGRDPGRSRPLAVVSMGTTGTPSLTFDSAESVDAAGIDVAPVWKTAMTETVPAAGEILFDPARVTRLSARAGGSCVRVGKSVGEPVEAGDLLAVIDAAEVGRAKADFLQALVQVRLRKQSLSNLNAAGAIVPVQTRTEAEAAVREADVRWLAAEQGLGNFGLPVRAADFAGLTPEEAVARLRTAGIDGPATSANLLPLRSPAAGVVMAADVVAGEVVGAGQVLFVVVDPSQVWLTLSVSANDARRVAIGHRVTFRPDGLATDFAGDISWVGLAIDEVTRTLPVRVVLDNREGQLRASTLGRGRIAVRNAPEALTVPVGAIQTVRGRPAVFVRDPDFPKAGGPKAFHLRNVRVGASDGQITEILDGLNPDEIVAAKNAAILAGEIQRIQSSSIGDRP